VAHNRIRFPPEISMPEVRLSAWHKATLRTGTGAEIMAARRELFWPWWTGVPFGSQRPRPTHLLQDLSRSALADREHENGCGHPDAVYAGSCVLTAHPNGASALGTDRASGTPGKRSDLVAHPLRAGEDDGGARTPLRSGSPLPGSATPTWVTKTAAPMPRAAQEAKSLSRTAVGDPARASAMLKQSPNRSLTFRTLLHLPEGPLVPPCPLAHRSP
jgi:hypothetical protein